MRYDILAVHLLLRASRLEMRLAEKKTGDFRGPRSHGATNRDRDPVQHWVEGRFKSFVFD